MGEMRGATATRLLQWAQLVAAIELVIGVAVVVVSLANPATDGLARVVVGHRAPTPTVGRPAPAAAPSAAGPAAAPGRSPVGGRPPATTRPVSPASRLVSPPPSTAVRPVPRGTAVPPLPPAAVGPGSGGDPADYLLWFPGVGIDGGPARWNPCQTITVAGGPALTAPILSELTTITGLRFAIVTGPAAIEITTGVVDSIELGSTHDDWVGGWMTHARIVLSPGTGSRMPTVLRHELGHAVGLSHSHGLAEVMTPGSHSPDYRAGDVNGLRQLGALAGPDCG